MTQQDIQAIKQRFKIIGNSAQLNRDIEVAVQVAITDLSVLITGESGVGKEHFPQIIHAYSARKHGPYFAINCGAIPEGTIDSELFGHEKGAFTDAKSERKGYFEIADGGTLFLDEVGELPLPTQVRLLRVLETGEFIRMGASQVQKTNVRVVAATNLNMQQAIREGRFREDLYYRLNTVEIKVPALRERKEDIPMLFRKFALDFAERYRMPAVRLNEQATKLLQSYYWNGNIRQLKNIAEQISIIETNHDITAETLSRYLPANELQQGISLSAKHQQGGDPYINERELLYKVLFDMKKDMSELKRQFDELKSQAVQDNHWSIPHTESTAVTYPSTEMTAPIQPNVWQDVEVIKEAERESIPVSNPPVISTMKDSEREAIRRALEHNHGSRKAAAGELGISERTLYRKIKEYELDK